MTKAVLVSEITTLRSRRSSARIEALLFAAAGPLSAQELARRLPEGADVGQALADAEGPLRRPRGRAGVRGRPLALPHRAPTSAS